MAKIVHYNDVPRDVKYERGLKIDFGVNDSTVGSKQLTMGHTIVPPGSRNQRHYHSCDACFYVIRGRIKVLLLDGKDFSEMVLQGGGTWDQALGWGETAGVPNATVVLDVVVVVVVACSYWIRSRVKVVIEESRGSQ